MLDLKEGMRMLDRWTMEHLRRQCRNMKQVNTLFPHLTATEVAMFPLLKEIPPILLLVGTNFESLEKRREDLPLFGKKDGLHQEDLATVPMQLEMRVDGIAYGDDTTKLVALKASDELHPADKEITFYKKEVGYLVQRLIILSIENPRILELIREKTADALIVGAGLIQREALELVRSRKEPVADDSME